MKVRKQHLSIALWVLAAAVAWTVWSYVSPPARPAPAAANQPLLGAGEAQAPTQTAGLDASTLPPPPPVDTVQGPSWARDPFLFGNESRAVTMAAQSVFTPDPLVRSILVSSTRRVALVENRMVSVGESVGSMKVVAIDPAAVVFVTESGERRRVAVHGAMPPGIKR